MAYHLNKSRKKNEKLEAAKTRAEERKKKKEEAEEIKKTKLEEKLKKQKEKGMKKPKAKVRKCQKRRSSSSEDEQWNLQEKVRTNPSKRTPQNSWKRKCKSMTSAWKSRNSPLKRLLNTLNRSLSRKDLI
uniref:Uncharacterized protein n=1 Tax=Lygus hesperus TaxID=30085 RepID=A0A146MDJ3_LYGHE